jgi:hypothetical protein
MSPFSGILGGLSSSKTGNSGGRGGWYKIGCRNFVKGKNLVFEP